MDWNWPITTELLHSSLIANNIIAKLTNQFIWTGYGTLNWQQLLTDSDDVVRSGYQNVSQQYRLKSISGLLSLRQLDYMIIHI